jgi:hypothetical protein
MHVQAVDHQQLDDGTAHVRRNPNPCWRARHPMPRLRYTTGSAPTKLTPSPSSPVRGVRSPLSDPEGDCPRNEWPRAFSS